VASGTKPFSYAWYKNGTAIENPKLAKEGARLVLQVANSQVTAALTDLYSVKVSNDGGEISSGSLTIQLLKFGPSNAALEGSLDIATGVQVRDRGQSITFSATPLVAEEGTTLAYQWLKNEVPIAGETRADYTIGSVNKDHAVSINAE